MHLIAPDPNPGRCGCHRAGIDADGYPTQKRCLDYEGHQGRCTFPEDPPRQASRPWQSASSQPQPWVSPLDKNRPVPAGTTRP